MFCEWTRRWGKGAQNTRRQSTRAARLGLARQGEETIRLVSSKANPLVSSRSRWAHGLFKTHARNRRPVQSAAKNADAERAGSVAADRFG